MTWTWETTPSFRAISRGHEWVCIPRISYKGNWAAVVAPLSEIELVVMPGVYGTIGKPEECTPCVIRAARSIEPPGPELGYANHACGPHRCSREHTKRQKTDDCLADYGFSTSVPHSGQTPETLPVRS